jgi:flagellar hook-associated protein 3 FlgL
MLSAVTSQSQVNTLLYYLDQQSNALAKLTEQASSGNQVLVPSDNPAGTVTIVNGTAQGTQYSAYLDNISSVTNTLNSSVTSLTSVDQILQQAATIATQGANTTNDSTSYQALAQQVTGLINQALTQANTQFNGQYLYSGTTTGVQPFTVASTNAQGQPESVSYNGSATSGQTVVNTGQTVNTTYSGSQVFQSSGGDVFQALIGLRDLLQNTTNLPANQQQQALSQQIGVINNAASAVRTSEGLQSADLQNLGALQTQITNLQTTTKQQVSNVQTADLPTVLVNLQAEENTYQVTLAATGRIFDQNLLTFLPPQNL